jgi:cellobiose-specific phosphotransferase system component IIC
LLGNWSLGAYVVNYTSSDFSGNQASCSFNVTVTRMRTQNLETSSAGASTTAFAGAGGGAGVLLILLICFILFMRRSHREVGPPVGYV